MGLSFLKWKLGLASPSYCSVWVFDPPTLLPSLSVLGSCSSETLGSGDGRCSLLSSDPFPP